MVVFDATFVMLFLDAKFKNGVGDSRVDFLVETLAKAKQRIIVPTPALSELLVGAGDAAPQYLDILNRSTHFRIEPFGTKAAVEAAAAVRDAIGKGDKRAPATTATWAKVKFDRQIVAIAAVNKATTIYSDDDDVAKLAQPLGIEVVTLADLPTPPTSSQPEFSLDPVEEASDDSSDD